MTTPHSPFIKVCGQTHAAMVDASLALGAQYVGFIFHEPSPRCITPSRAAAIPTRFATRVGVFVRQRAKEIASIMEQAHLHLAQFHGRQDTHDAELIGPQRVIRVLWPEHCQDLAQLQALLDEWEPYCAYYMLDAGDAPGRGGTGRNLNVQQFSSLRFPHPWILAGGLDARSIPQLLANCHPDGIDLNSGVEIAPGLKDASKLLAAVHALHQATLSRA